MKVVGRFHRSRCLGSGGDLLKGDTVAEAFESMDEVAFGAAVGEAVEISIAEVLVRLHGFMHVESISNGNPSLNILMHFRG